MAEEQSKMMSKFRANGDFSASTTANKVNKRNRQPLSCLPCRQRKLKCDRAHPCDTCTKRDEAGLCVYTKTARIGTGDGGSRAKAHDRLRQLEQLVMQMVDANNLPDRESSNASLSKSVSAAADGTPKDGRLEGSGKYVGSTHWSAILDNINELKSAMATDGPDRADSEDANDSDTPDQEILFGCGRALSLQEILKQYLPSRVQMDRFLSTYFNAKYRVIPYIHTYYFQRQYERFWRDPPQVDALWLSLLFSICCLGAQLTAATASISTVADDAKAQIKTLLLASAQCLILGGYTRPNPHVVEALALYAQCKYVESLDPSREVGIIFPMLIRLAYRMGYHRDPANFPRFSVFEGEMRRRVWTMCRQFDLMISFQLGLPNNIPVDSWDTLPPRNLLDSDFDENTQELPPSRPENEATQILYFIIKSRLMENFGRICNHALSFKNSSQTEIMTLDTEVRQTFSTVPDILRVRPMSQSFADPSYLVMVRLNCKFLYEKSLLVLHRKYMTQGFELSTKACVDAAMAICNCFNDMHKEFQPGGQLYHDRWMLSSFTMNDFLLATMILCLSLSQWRRRNTGKDINIDTAASEQLQMLQTCYAICVERAPASTEARKVAEGIKTMLDQFPKSGTVSLLNIAMTTQPKSNNDPQIQPDSSTVNLTPLSINDTSTNTGSHSNLGDTPNPFSNFFDSETNPSTMNIDWQFLDQYLVNANQYDNTANFDVSINGTSSNNAPNNFDTSGGAGLFPGLNQDWTSTPYRFLGGSRDPALKTYSVNGQQANVEIQPFDPRAMLDTMDSIRHGTANVRQNGNGSGQNMAANDIPMPGY